MVGRKESKHNWEAIRRYYEAGHTVEECRRHFGFGGSSWTRAVARGDVSPRSRGRGSANVERRELVSRMISEDITRTEIAARLGVSLATVAYYVRALELPVDERCGRRYDWTEVQRYHDAGHTARECQERFGFASQTWHKARRRGAITTRPPGAPIATYLVKGRRVARSHLKARLLAEGLKQGRCEECGLSEWRRRPLPRVAPRQRRW